MIFIVIASQNSLNDLLLLESDAEMSAFSDGGLESEIIAFVAEKFTVEICCRTYRPSCTFFRWRKPFVNW